MVKNTVDARLAELQLKKLRTIAKAIKDRDSSKMTLTEEDIASLLGRVVRDEKGKIVAIELDYDDETDEDGGHRVWRDEVELNDDDDSNIPMGEGHQAQGST